MVTVPRVVPACRIGHDPRRSSGSSTTGAPGQVDCQPAVGQEQADLEVLDLERGAQDALDVLRGGAAGAEVVEEAGQLS